MNYHDIGKIQLTGYFGNHNIIVNPTSIAEINDRGVGLTKLCFKDSTYVYVIQTEEEINILIEELNTSNK